MFNGTRPAIVHLMNQTNNGTLKYHQQRYQNATTVNATANTNSTMNFNSTEPIYDLDINLGKYGSTEAINVDSHNEINADGLLNWGKIDTGNEDELNCYTVDCNAKCEANDLDISPDTEDIDEEDMVYTNSTSKNNTNSVNSTMNATANNSTMNATADLVDTNFMYNSTFNLSTLTDSTYRNISTSMTDSEGNLSFSDTFPVFNDFTFTNFLLDSAALINSKNNTFNAFNNTMAYGNTASLGNNFTNSTIPVSVNNSTNTNTTMAFNNSTDIEAGNTTQYINTTNSTEVGSNTTNSTNSEIEMVYDDIHYGNFTARMENVRATYNASSDADLEVVADSEDEEGDDDHWLREKLDEFYASFDSFLPTAIPGATKKMI